VKVLLIKHPTTHFEKTAPPVSGLPLGLLYIAASLRKAGHDVHIYDAIVGADERRWDGAFVDGVYRMGATQEEIQRVVSDIGPDVVGISNQFTSQVDNALRTAIAVKKVNPGITVIAGGPHAAVMPSTFFEHPGAFDYAVMGEGEDTIVELLDCLQYKRDAHLVAGIAYMDDGKLIIREKRKFIDNLDALPLPAYDLLDMERYFYFNKKGKDGRESYRYPGSERSISMITSRGCPFNCVFCSIHLGMGRRFRAHSVTYVLDHIQQVKERYAIRHIHFEDDNFSFDMNRFNGILDGMMKRDFQVTWDTPNGVRADYLNETSLTKCRESGCTYLRIGVESANAEVSKKIVRKSLDLGKVVEIARLCRKTGIDIEAFYIIGFPGETVAQMKETISFAVRQERRHGIAPYNLFTATPLIGTDLYKICTERGYITKELSSRNIATATQGEGMITTEEFSPDVLKSLIRSYWIRHRISQAIYSLKFMLAHPRYLLIKLTTWVYLKRLMDHLLKGQMMAAIGELFFYKYKNCVVRKVGLS